MKGTTLKSSFTFSAVWCALIIGQVVRAQESVNYASIGGRVTDASGAVVEGAQVKARQKETNLISTADTDREGRFRFPYLHVGPYEIKVHYQGFAD